MPKIMTWSFKGGVGKTTLALAIALEKEYGIITNDLYSPVDRVLPQGRSRILDLGEAVPHFPDEYNLIYDFGGYIDQRAAAIVELVDTVIVPTTNDPLSLQSCINAVAEIKELARSVVVVVNRCRKGDFEVASKQVSKFHGDITILQLKESKLFLNLINDKQAASAIRDQSGLNRYLYSEPVSQLTEILKAINLE